MFGNFWKKITSNNSSFSKEELASLEEKLLLSNVCLAVVQDVISIIKKAESANLKITISDYLMDLLETKKIKFNPFSDDGTTQTMLVLGVNGVGKTTSIAKICNLFKDKNLMLAAADTYRAAAIEQMKYWGEKVNVPVISQEQGANSSAVIYDAMTSAVAKNVDLLIADTAGRLQNKEELMDELSKIVRVMKKFDTNAPHKVILVCDITTGSNAVKQVEAFNKVIKIDALIYTKADITKKAGTIVSIAHKFDIPIAFVCDGEKLEDIRPFNPNEFVRDMVN